MNRTDWGRASGRRLDFGRFAKTEYLIVGALGAVILVAVILVVANFVGGTTPPTRVSAYHYKCDKCGNEFDKKPEDFPLERTPSDGAKKLLVDCPKCKAVASAWRMTQCPNPQCHKFYVSDLTTARYTAFMRGVGEPAGIQEKCPYCGTVVSEWYRQHPPKE